MGVFKRVKSVRASIAAPKTKTVIEKSRDKRLPGKPFAQIKKSVVQKTEALKQKIAERPVKLFKRKYVEPEQELEDETQSDYDFNDSESKDYNEGY